MGLSQSSLAFLAGLGFAVMGIAARAGVWKEWYWSSRRGPLSWIPLGCLLVLASVSTGAVALPAEIFGLFQGALVRLGLVSVVGAVRTPAALRPLWVRWVEGYPSDVYRMMCRAVRADADWKPHVSSQAAVDAWVQALRQEKQ